ncbi:hypothetical protein DOTSEDRAFT_83074 [Dothistroma septosporum NZE10]|uniref:Uncharacterized protein n=1 Tax=Dothistroma septosporum (strain NZE10 / CBS 128990) TaxID=675120 RepID=M2YJY7_DOTSN|nr:hypothetical protein DOTSEDRAFT_83074 [Dothistroma septosporum NZE10]
MHVSPHTVEVNVAISKRLYRAIKKSPTHRGPDTAAKVKVGGEIAALVFNAVEFSTYHDSSKPGSRYAAGIRIPLPMRPFNDIKSGAIKAENLDMETTKVAIMGRRMVFKAWRDPNYEAPTTAKDDGPATETLVISDEDETPENVPDAGSAVLETGQAHTIDLTGQPDEEESNLGTSSDEARLEKLIDHDDIDRSTESAATNERNVSPQNAAAQDSAPDEMGSLPVSGLTGGDAEDEDDLHTSTEARAGESGEDDKSMADDAEPGSADGEERGQSRPVSPDQGSTDGDTSSLD